MYIRKRNEEPLNDPPNPFNERLMSYFRTFGEILMAIKEHLLPRQLGSQRHPAESIQVDSDNHVGTMRKAIKEKTNIKLKVKERTSFEKHVQKMSIRALSTPILMMSSSNKTNDITQIRQSTRKFMDTIIGCKITLRIYRYFGHETTFLMFYLQSYNKVPNFTKFGKPKVCL